MEVRIVGAIGNQTPLRGRVYQINAPESAEMPYCRFFDVISVDTICHDGIDGLQRRRFQFDFFGENTFQLSEIRSEVKRILNDCFTISEASQRSQADQEQDIYHYILDVTFWD